MEGTRPLLVEVQALVASTEVVPPRRVANGIDRNRLSMILAVLARHGGPSLGSADVFVNVAGGVRIEEPGADLAVALAIASAAREQPLDGRRRPGRLLRRDRPHRGAALRRACRPPARGGGPVRASSGWCSRPAAWTTSSPRRGRGRPCPVRTLAEALEAALGGAARRRAA